MQENNNIELANAVDNINDLNNILKYLFVSDRALNFAVCEGVFDLRDDEISGMNSIKDMVLDKYSALENSLQSIHDNMK